MAERMRRVHKEVSELLAMRRYSHYWLGLAGNGEKKGADTDLLA
jgi:hypothetical protein